MKFVMVNFNKLQFQLWRSLVTKIILKGTVQGGRRKGRQKKRWDDNISERTGLGLDEALRKAEDREE